MYIYYIHIYFLSFLFWDLVFLTSIPKHTQDLGGLFIVVVVVVSFFFSFLDKMTIWRNSPRKIEQEVLLTASYLMSTDISKMFGLEFKTIIQMRAGLEKSKEDTRESLIVEIKELKSSKAKIKKAITKMQSQVEAIKISDMEDKIMEYNEAEKKREIKLLDH